MDLLRLYHSSTLKPSVIPTASTITFHILAHVKGSLHCDPSPPFIVISMSLGDLSTPARLVCPPNLSFLFSDAKQFSSCLPYPSTHSQVHLIPQGILITHSTLLSFARIPSPSDSLNCPKGWHHFFLWLRNFSRSCPSKGALDPSLIVSPLFLNPLVWHPARSSRTVPARFREWVSACLQQLSVILPCF